MQTAVITPTKKKKRTRMRYSNRFKVLLCYLVSFALPPLWQLGSLLLIYPYQLKNSAPLIAENLSGVFPFLKNMLEPYVQRAAEPAGGPFSAEMWETGAVLYLFINQTRTFAPPRSADSISFRQMRTVSIASSGRQRMTGSPAATHSEKYLTSL